MGSNNNKNQQNQQQQNGYGPNPGTSGTDPRGQVQNQIGYQQQRYENQQGPLADSMAYNYGRGTESDFGNYTNMMNQYNDIASNGGGGGYSGGGGGGGGGYSAFLVNPERVNAAQAGTERATTRALGPLERVTAGTATAQKLNPLERVQTTDPYNSYKGFQEFGQTGGYSPQDIQDMRARGVAPIRAAYGNAERAIGQQRSLQGGYSPNAIAAQVKMAREQGQSMADASQNVDAGIAQARNAGRLSGYQGMGNIESQQQQAALDAAKFNATQGLAANQFDVSNDLSNQQFNIGNQLDASKFNSGQAFQGQQFDIGNETNTSQFNAGQGNQVGMYNAGQTNNMGQFNADLNYKGQVYNADAQTQAQARNAAAGAAASAQAAAYNQQQTQNRLAALGGAQNLYGTTPGMSNMFGSQVSNIVGQGGNMGLGYINAQGAAGQMPGAYDQTMGRITDSMNLFGRGMDAAGGFLGNGNQQPPPPSFSSRVNNNFNPGNYGQQVQMGTPPPYSYSDYWE